VSPSSKAKNREWERAWGRVGGMPRGKHILTVSDNAGQRRKTCGRGPVSGVCGEGAIVLEYKMGLCRAPVARACWREQMGMKVGWWY
jgi:hypothetical protein